MSDTVWPRPTFTPLTIIDEVAFERETLKALAGRPAFRLTTTPLPSGPGTYLLFYDGPHSILKSVAEPVRWPVYCGSAFNVAARRRRHVVSLAATELDPDDFLIVVLPTLTGGAALAYEFALLAALEPLFSQHWLRGLGSRFPGNTRRGQPSPFDVLFPGRHWASGTAASTVAIRQQRAALERRARAHLSAQRVRALREPLGVRVVQPNGRRLRLAGKT